MRISHTSRRNFLTSLAILSAGSALGSMTRILGESTTGLQKDWKLFCSRNGGIPFYPTSKWDDKIKFQPCRGHYYKSGEPVYFSDGDIIGVPVWISWGKEKTTPDDLIVTFFNEEGQKIVNLNRFELSALNALPVDMEESNSSLLRKMIQPNESSKKKYCVKTSVGKGRDTQVLVQYDGLSLNFKKQLIYNI